MKPTCAMSLAAGCVGLLPCSRTVQAQETPPVVVKESSKDFIYFAGRTHSIYVSLRSPDDAKDKARVAVDSFSVATKMIAADLREFPEIKLECAGVKYVLLPRRIVVVPPEPDKQGVFVQTALDPNGTGNVEVLLTINYDKWPDTSKKIAFVSRLLPKTMEVVESSSSWSHPSGGLAWTGTLVFRNNTGVPFILGTTFFENLLTTEGWPIIIIPPTNQPDP